MEYYMVTHVHLQLLYGATVEMHSRYSAYMAVKLMLVWSKCEALDISFGVYQNTLWLMLCF